MEFKLEQVNKSKDKLSTREDNKNTQNLYVLHTNDNHLMTVNSQKKMNSQIKGEDSEFKGNNDVLELNQDLEKASNNIEKDIVDYEASSDKKD